MYVPEPKRHVPLMISLQIESYPPEAARREGGKKLCPVVAFQRQYTWRLPLRFQRSALLRSQIHQAISLFVRIATNTVSAAVHLHCPLIDPAGALLLSERFPSKLDSLWLLALGIHLGQILDLMANP
jgi:hypothetical protein